jgi:hypothetical protein
MRKVRKDSKLHGLAKEQRALVDKWLFDKGLTYQEVAEACLQMFGLKVSRSSVGRYHERQAQGKVRRKKEECRKGMEEGKTGTLEENYQYCLKRMANWVLEEMKWPVADERDVKTVFRFMRVLIASRRERNEAILAEVARRKFEMKAARECIKYFREEEARGQSKVHPPSPELLRRTRSPKSKVGEAPAYGRHIEMLSRGEKDPMMVWNFPDGEIRRMPLLRQARAGGEGG